MFENVDWSNRGTYMEIKHGVTVQEAREALCDPERVVIHPDYNSRSRRTTRIIGYSDSAGALLTIITLENDGNEYGVNGWKSNAKDQTIYLEQEVR